MGKEDGRLIGVPGILAFHVQTLHGARAEARSKFQMAQTGALYEGQFGNISSETLQAINKARTLFETASPSIKMEVLGHGLKVRV